MRDSKSLYGIGRRALLGGAVGGFMLSAPAIHAQARTAGAALVIGNARYQWEAPLPNVKRDAPDIAQAFQSLGLKTDLVLDAGRDAMNRAIDSFKSGLRGADFGAIYFAGHGAQWVKDSYLVPTDADLGTPNAVDQLVPVSAINHGMLGARHRLMVFDNCRNNPADGWSQLQTERAAIVHTETQLRNPQPPNTLVLFSTSPGRVALDGPAGEHSPFCAALLRQLHVPAIDLQALPGILRRDLLIATGGKQVVWDRGSYATSYQLPGARGLAATSRQAGGDDPKAIVELTNAYAYAHQNGLPLPAGLIAYRPAGGARKTEKVGSYKFIALTPAGKVDALIIVMSVDDGGTAECIFASKSPTGPFWRFITATVSGGSLDYTPRDGAARFSFSWSDADSGRLTQIKEDVGKEKQGRIRANAGYSTGFTRLDG